MILDYRNHLVSAHLQKDVDLGAGLVERLLDGNGHMFGKLLQLDLLLFANHDLLEDDLFFADCRNINPPGFASSL